MEAAGIYTGYREVVRNRPPYVLQSVDAALKLVQTLQTFGPMRVSDAAAELGVAVSTAHRLLAMLMYRGFAEQLPDRRYGPGVGLRPIPILDAAAGDLRGRALGPMVALVETLNESANLVVLAGTDIRFVATVECNRALRVGDRAGQLLPAHLTSGGKAILATFPDSELRRFRELGPVAVAKLRTDVQLARHAGYATNHQDTEKGLTAFGVALAPLPGAIRSAICLAMPTSRFRRALINSYVAALTQTAREIEAAFGSD
jgi:IclR family transcriptional regulator, acetate operon repressor